MGKGIAAVFSAALAFGAGIIAGMLFAPDSGAENRKKLGKQIRSYSDSIEHQLEDVEKTLSRAEKQVLETGKELKSRVKEAATRVKDQIGTEVSSVTSQWEMDRSDIAKDLPKMPKV